MNKLTVQQQWLYQFLFVDPNKLAPFPMNHEYLDTGATLAEMSKHGLIKSFKLNNDGLVDVELKQ